MKRLFVQVYADGFPVGNYGNSTAIYISLGNFPSTVLMNLDSYFCVGQYPKGANSSECFGVFTPELVKLQNGFTYEIPGTKKEWFFCGGVGIGKFDYPEAQTQAGCLQQGANFPDRFSHSPKQDMNDLKLNFDDVRKTLTQVRQIRSAQSLAPTSKETADLLKQNGMHEIPSMWENPVLEFNVTLQDPPMTEHCEVIGMGGKVITFFLNELSPGGQTSLLSAMYNQVIPPHWDLPASLRLSSEKKLKCGAQDILRNLQLLPFAIHGRLALPPVQATALSNLERESRFAFTKVAQDKYRSRGSNGTKSLYTMIMALALSQKCTHAKTRASGIEQDGKSLAELGQVILKLRREVLHNYPDDFNTVNFRTGLYIPQATHLYGVPSALNLLMEESNHNIFKLQVT